VSAADIVEVAVCVVPLIGLAITCWIDPAKLADRKYGPKK
jgi:hypothetical protein